MASTKYYRDLGMLKIYVSCLETVGTPGVDVKSITEQDQAQIEELLHRAAKGKCSVEYIKDIGMHCRTSLTPIQVC